MLYGISQLMEIKIPGEPFINSLLHHQVDYELYKSLISSWNPHEIPWLSHGPWFLPRSKTQFMGRQDGMAPPQQGMAAVPVVQAQVVEAQVVATGAA